MAKHKHAELMMQYAQDAMTTDTPWELWQYRKGSLDKWCNHINSPWWVHGYEYRRKPKTIEFQSIERPNSLRLVPSMDERYYFVSCIEDTMETRSFSWEGDVRDYMQFYTGNCFATEAEAEQFKLTMMNRINEGE